VKKIDSVKI